MRTGRGNKKTKSLLQIAMGVDVCDGCRQKSEAENGLCAVHQEPAASICIFASLLSDLL